MALIIPALFIAVFGYAAVKKVNVYNSFSGGVESALKFTLSLLPCLAAVFMMCALFEAGGLSGLLIETLSPVFGFLGVPEELTKLILIKPFSGSGSLAYLTQIIEERGADSYQARCACVCYGSSETVFYVSAIYFAGLKTKGLMRPIAISLFSSLVATAAACALCTVI